MCDFDNSIWVKEPINEKNSSIQYYGTLTYTSPELLKESFANGFAADMWAVGILCAQLLLNDPSFMDSSSQLVLAQNLTKFFIDRSHFDQIDVCMKNFLFELLDVNPKNRMTAKKALNHILWKNNKSFND